MMRPLALFLAAVLPTLVASACQPRRDDDARASEPALNATADAEFATVPDSAWVTVSGLTLVGFYPNRSNEQLERDADFATVLDDFSYHLGTAMDSLQAAGVAVHLRAGDTLWLRTGTDRWRFARPADSADVGYVFADTLLRRTVIYGVRTYTDLVEYAHEFRRTGKVSPR